MVVVLCGLLFSLVIPGFVICKVTGPYVRPHIVLSEKLTGL